MIEFAAGRESLQLAGDSPTSEQNDIAECESGGGGGDVYAISSRLAVQRLDVLNCTKK